MTVKQLIGAGKAEDRVENDFYPTPSYVTNALLERESFDGPIWEPACGDGAISKVLENRGYDVRSSDLNDYGYGEIGCDFLKTRESFPNIVTNPPFNIGTPFTIHALKVATKKVAILNKLAFLEGKTRKKSLFCYKMLEKVYVFSSRVQFNPDPKKAGSMIAFAWFVWNKEYKGNPRIEWI
jgi:hypothetical protein